MINKKWFYNNSEGYLGDDEQVKILFVMKEPNSQGEEVVKDEFWLRRVIRNEVDTNYKGRRYFTILGKVACILLEFNDKREALERCAFINLFPVSGKQKVDNLFRNQIKLFSECKEEYNRWNIINNLPDKSIIVTTPDIASTIEKVKRQKNLLTNRSTDYCLSISDTVYKSFHCQIENGNYITVYALRHPGAYGRYYFTEDDVHRKLTDPRAS